MAANSLNALTFLFVIGIAILAPSATANTAAAAAPGGELDPFLTEEFSILSCISFVGDATKCMRDVFKQAIAPHPSCCEAIAKLNKCSPSVFKDIPSLEWTVIKDVCASWGVTIS